ncbi:MAG: hypothetical protein ACPH9Q_07450 [Schleiferiaceae bacterium]
MNKKLDNKELFKYLMRRFNMTENEALNSMENNGYSVGLLRMELNTIKHNEKVFGSLIKQMANKGNK